MIPSADTLVVVEGERVTEIPDRSRYRRGQTPQTFRKWVLAQAYATFAARGLHCDPRPVTQVLDSQGQTLKDFTTQCEVAAGLGNALGDLDIGAARLGIAARVVVRHDDRVLLAR